eukprot:scaffold6281_cov207-Ochromonas_danica.AAC.2
MAVAKRDEKRSRFTSPLKRAAPAPLHAGTHIEPTPPTTPSRSRNSSQGQNDPSSSALASETLSTARKGMLKLFSLLSSMLAMKEEKT